MKVGTVTGAWVQKLRALALSPLTTSPADSGDSQHISQGLCFGLFPLHLMASFYTYRQQTFGFVFAIAYMPSAKQNMLLTNISTRQSYKMWLVVAVWWEPRERDKQQTQRHGNQLNKMRRGKCFPWEAGTQNM